MSDRNVETSLSGGSTVTRRDFIEGTLVGAGAALLASCGSPTNSEKKASNELFAAQDMTKDLGPSWTGPGGAGDYKLANGNTHDVVNRAHALWNGTAKDQQAEDTGEVYDLIIVGSGFAGMSAAYTAKKAAPNAKILIIDNHAMFGGAAKQNEFEVDGVRLVGPQGSHGLPGPKALVQPLGIYHRYYEELGLPEPEKISYAELQGTNKPLRIADNSYMPMHWQWESANVGHFFRNSAGKLEMFKDPWNNGLADLPIDSTLKRDLLAMELYRMPPPRPDWEKWLDSISYQDFLTKVMGLSPEVADYIDPSSAGTGMGVSADAVSAYAAYLYGQPGPAAYGRMGGADFSDLLYLKSLPGGNAGILRHFVKALIPEAIPGPATLGNVFLGGVDFSALDRSGQAIRIRLNSTVRQLTNVSGGVEATYLRDGQLQKVRGKAAIAATPQMATKFIVADMPSEQMAASTEFIHAPMLTINVALRNWRAMEKLGISAARRWDNALCWFSSIRRPMIVDGKPVSPLDPSKPIVVTMYISFPKRGLSANDQAVSGRRELFAMSFAEIEKRVRNEFTEMFGPGGFDADKDIAGIVTNRWGHAYLVTPPGFYFGKDGKKSPLEIMKQPFERIAFAHSELQGVQTWEGAATEGERAANEMLRFI